MFIIAAASVCCTSSCPELNLVNICLGLQGRARIGHCTLKLRLCNKANSNIHADSGSLGSDELHVNARTLSQKLS
jgi:hypothetical protein